MSREPTDAGRGGARAGARLAASRRSTRKRVAARRGASAARWRATSRAPRTQPPFANSAMDGYALRAADAAAAPARLTRRRRIRGRPRLRRRASGPARRCASSPARRCPRAPTRCRCRRTRRRDGDVGDRSARRWRAGDHVRGAGVDFRRGRDAAAGRPAADRRATSRWPPPPIIRRCAVRRRPRVAILATGDELARAGRGARAGADRRLQHFRRRRRSSRRRAASRSISASRPTIRDALADRLAAARRAKADVLVTLGGASVGDHDLVQQGARRRRHGARLLAHRHAAGQAADARPPRRDAACSACPAIRPRRPSAPFCSCAAGARAARRSRRRRRRRANRRGSPSTCPPTASARTTCARRLARDDGGHGGDADRRSGFLAGAQRSPTPTRCSSRPPHAPPARAGETCRILRFAPLGA